MQAKHKQTADQRYYIYNAIINSQVHKHNALTFGQNIKVVSIRSRIKHKDHVNESLGYLGMGKVTCLIC